MPVCVQIFFVQKLALQEQLPDEAIRSCYPRQ